jgi:hypothetical protein
LPVKAECPKMYLAPTQPTLNACNYTQDPSLNQSHTPTVSPATVTQTHAHSTQPGTPTAAHTAPPHYKAENNRITGLTAVLGMLCVQSTCMYVTCSHTHLIHPHPQTTASAENT